MGTHFGISKEETARLLAYFWESKGDIEGWSGFDRETVAREFPAVLKAWDDYKTSRLVLDAVIRDMKSGCL